MKFSSDSISITWEFVRNANYWAIPWQLPQKFWGKGLEICVWQTLQVTLIYNKVWELLSLAWLILCNVNLHFSTVPFTNLTAKNYCFLSKPYAFLFFHIMFPLRIFFLCFYTVLPILQAYSKYTSFMKWFLLPLAGCDFTFLWFLVLLTKHLI